MEPNVGHAPRGHALRCVQAHTLVHYFLLPQDERADLNGASFPCVAAADDVIRRLEKER